MQVMKGCSWKKIAKGMRSGYFLSFVAVVAVFFSIVYLTPYRYDDIFYSFVIPTLDTESPRLVTSFQDVVQSFIPHFQYVNGRCFTNTIIQQSLTRLMPVWMHALINTLVFIGTCIILCKMILEDGVKTLSLKKNAVLLMTAILLFALVPTFFYINSWRDGASNYLWPGLFYAALWYGYFVAKKPNVGLMCLLFAFCGLLNEVFALPMLLFLGLDFLIKPSWKKVAYGGAMLAAVTTILLTPMAGRGGRALVDVLTQLGLSKILDVLRALVTSQTFLMVCVVLAIGLYRYRQSTMVFIKKNRAWLMLAGCYILTFIFVGAGGGAKKYYPLHILSVVLLVKYMLTMVWTTKRAAAVWGLAALTFLGVAASLVRDVLDYRRQFAQEVETVRTDPNGIVMNDFSNVQTIQLDESRHYTYAYEVCFRDSLQMATLPPIKMGLGEEVYRGIYKTDSYCTKAHQIIDGVYNYKGPRREYAFFKVDNDVVKGQKLICGFKHVEMPMAPLNTLLDKMRPAKKQSFEVQAVLKTLYGTTYVILEMPPNIGYRLVDYEID